MEADPPHNILHVLMQQSEVLMSAGIPTATLCGDLCQERWGLTQWQHMCSTHTAIVMTPDACVFSLMHARLKVGFFLPPKIHA